MSPRRDELLAALVKFSDGSIEHLRRLSPAFGVMVQQDPGSAAGLLSGVPEDAKVGLLESVDSAQLISGLGLGEEDADPGEVSRRNDSLMVIFAEMWVHGLLDEARLRRCMKQCAALLESSTDLETKAAWLERVQPWVSRGDGGHALEELAPVLDPLLAATALAAGDIDFEAGTAALSTAASILLTVKADSASMSERIARCATSESADAGLSAQAAGILLEITEAFGAGHWPYAEQVIGAAEALRTQTDAFARSCSTIGMMVRLTGSEGGLAPEQIDRIAGIACRRGAAGRVPEFVQDVLRNARGSKQLVNRILSLDYFDADLMRAAWEESPACRIQLLQHHVDPTSIRAVTSTIDQLGQIVGLKSLRDALADYIVGRLDGDAQKALRIVRGASKSQAGASPSALSRRLLAITRDAPRSDAIEALALALDLGVTAEQPVEWKDAAKAIDRRGIGANQMLVMSRAKKVLRFRG